MIELRGKAVADAHKAVLSERLAELQANVCSFYGKNCQECRLWC